MLRRNLVNIFILSNLMQIAAATDKIPHHSVRPAIQAAFSADTLGSGFGIGVVRYAPMTEIGLTASGTTSSTKNGTQIFSPVVFGGLRKEIGFNTFIAGGVNFVTSMGKFRGETIHSQYEVGPYASLENMLTPNLMLSGWILPYQYDNNKIGNNAVVVRHEFFSAGGIALNYLF